jgi:hypothetical protein
MPDTWAAPQVDLALAWFGTNIENQLNELDARLINSQ